jgi:5-methylcytosine-specific restriction endonuclease McrA
MYDLPSLLPRAGINLNKIRISHFCKICTQLLLDPNLLFSYNGEQIALPELKHDYQNQSVLLTEKAEKQAAKELIGKRLRYYRKLCGITGAKVAALWPEYASGETTQSTISNHETARFNEIKLVDIVAYINIYNSIIPLDPPEAPVLPGQITLDDILFGCKFSSLMESVSLAKLTDNNTQSSPVETCSRDEAVPISKIDLSDPRYPQSALRLLLIKMAGGICEYCNKPAPFKGKDEVPYLEIHRIDRSKEITLTNCVALCPNCHRMITYLQDDQMNKVLQEKASHHTESSLFE